MTKIKTVLKILGISVSSLILFAGVGLGAWTGVLLAKNQYFLQVQLRGEQEIIVEYASEYKDDGASAQFYGTYLHKDPVEVPVAADGQVDTGKLGDYRINYTASRGNYVGMASRIVRVVDTQMPEITLVTDPEHYTIPGQAYEEEGYTAKDNYDGDLTGQVTVTHKKNVVVYTVMDSSGNVASVERKIVYKDPVAPAIALSGSSFMTLPLGQVYQEPGYLAADNVDGVLTSNVKVTGTVDTGKNGVYTLKYTVKDSYGNVGVAERTVTVTDKGFGAPEQVVPKEKVIYLTFDDGPGPYTGKLLDILKEYDVKATFFVTKKPKHYNMIKRAYQEGHTIGIHTMSHTYKKVYANEEAYFKDLYGMQQIITELTGNSTTLVRFPGGSSNTVSKKYSKGLMTRLTEDVVTRGFQYFDWNVDSDDAGKAKSADAVFKNVINGISGKSYAIVLQHDIKNYSVNAVERIIKWGLANGYTFRALDTTSPGCHHRVQN